MRKLAAGPFAMALLLCAGLCSQPLAARDQVRVAGSSTLFPFATAVAETFGNQGRWKTPVVESVGTGGGFSMFCAGVGDATPDITDASRPMSSAETATCKRNGVTSVLGFRIGLDGMLLVNAIAGPAFALTREQLYRAVARTVPVGGKLLPNPYRRWKDIAPHLPDMPIRVYGPAPNHGSRDAFVALAMVPACEPQPAIHALSLADRQQYCQRIREDGAWIDVSADYAVLFGRLVADPTSMGVLGFSWLERNRDRIKAAPIDGIAPTRESIGSWKYPLARPLFIYVKQAHVGRIPGLAEFVREFLGDRAIGPRGYLLDRGLMPLPAAALALERAKLEHLQVPAGK
jgi:phosphate transport system substrate-binding protein